MTVHFLLLFTPCVLAKQLELLKLLLLLSVCWEIEFQVQIFGLFPFTCSHWITNLDLLCDTINRNEMGNCTVHYFPLFLSFFLSFSLSAFVPNLMHCYINSILKAEYLDSFWTYGTPLNIKIKHDNITKQWKCCHAIKWKNKCYHAIWMWSHDYFYAIISGSGSSAKYWSDLNIYESVRKKQKNIKQRKVLLIIIFFSTLHNVLYIGI